ncbi:MAG: glycosyltransferase, partial [Schleiferiaceae bacterium]|nr:glycosyltransferase [Schleiferiaceae bacterium]
MDSLLIACTLTLLVPYVLFPQFMRWLAPGSPEPTDLNDPNEWPTVDILFAAYNEVAVLDRKLQSMLVVDYPMEKLRIFVGSDCSDDGSEEILESFAKKHDNLHWVPMSKRSGKSAIINHLVDLSKG